MDGWPEQVRAMQRNWIGRSEGVDIDFTVEAPGRTPPVSTLTVYTTRPDTLFGCTYVAVAPITPGEGRGGGRPGPRGLSRRVPEGTGGRSRSGHPGEAWPAHPFHGAPSSHRRAPAHLGG